MDEVLGYRQTVGGVVGQYFVHSNHLYSPAALTDSTGGVVERYTYDAYGRQTITSGAGAGRSRSAVGYDRAFTGYVADQETGLYHARTRPFSPTLGGFLSRDLWKRDGERPRSGDGYQDGLSLYRGWFIPNHLDPKGTDLNSDCDCSCDPDYDIPGDWARAMVGPTYTKKIDPRTVLSTDVIGTCSVCPQADKVQKTGTRKVEKWANFNSNLLGDWAWQMSQDGGQGGLNPNYPPAPPPGIRNGPANPGGLLGTFNTIIQRKIGECTCQWSCTYCAPIY